MYETHCDAPFITTSLKRYGKDLGRATGSAQVLLTRIR